MPLQPISFLRFLRDPTPNRSRPHFAHSTFTQHSQSPLLHVAHSAAVSSRKCSIRATRLLSDSQCFWAQETNRTQHVSAREKFTNSFTADTQSIF